MWEGEHDLLLVTSFGDTYREWCFKRVEVVAAGRPRGKGEGLGQVSGVCMGFGLVDLDECVSSWGYAEIGVGEGRSSTLEFSEMGAGVAPEI